MGGLIVRELAVMFSLIAMAPLACAQLGEIGPDAGRMRPTYGPTPALSAGSAWVFPASDASVPQVLGWEPASRVAIDAQRVYALSTQLGSEPSRLVAISRVNGTLAWWAELPDAVFDSWSSPTLDRSNGTVLIGAGSPGSAGGTLFAFDAVNGSVVWQVGLSRDVVNASPVVTDDLGPADRAIIVDYEGFYQGGSGAAAVCINVDPFDATLNPFEPGDVVWSVDLHDGASGATPAYADGLLYVGTTGDALFGTGGRVVCMDARASDASNAVVWDTNIGGDEGFFGGLAMAGGSVFGVTYDFFGSDRSSRLVKLRASDGAVRWSAPSDRSSAVPVVLSDGRVLVSAGIEGFGSVPRLTLYRDMGIGAVELWDSARDTWQDDGDGIMEPGEYLRVGGWSYQPSVRLERGRSLAVVGRLGAGGMAAVDLGLVPTDAGFVADAVGLDGGSVTYGFEACYAVTGDGVAAFGVPIWPDVDGDLRADGNDLRAWDRGIGRLDVDLDAGVDAQDAAVLESYVRRNELWDMVAGRRP